MYKDIFDIKGPYLNFLQYLGYTTGIGRYGIFIIEIINLSITLYFLQKSVDLIAKKYRHNVCLFLYLRYKTEEKIGMSAFLESIFAMRWSIIIVFVVIEVMAMKECWYNRQKRLFLIINLIIMFITLNMGNAYIHYYQILIPSILAAFWIWWGYLEDMNDIRKRMSIFLSVAIIFNLVYVVPYSGRIVAAVGLNTQKRVKTSFGKIAEK